MATSTQKPVFPIHIGPAQIRLHDVQIGNDILLDEVDLDGGDVLVESTEGPEKTRVTAGETRFRAMMSENNLNRLLAANLPPDAALQNLRIAALTGKVRITGQIVRILRLPLTLEGVPRLENGVRVFLNWSGVQAAGIPLPGQLVEILEQQLNRVFDLTQLPIPVWLDEVRCEPGRVTVLGRARLTWPLPAIQKITPFATPTVAEVPAIPTSSPETP